MEGGGDLFYQTEDKHDFSKPKKINFYVVERTVHLSMLLCMAAGDFWVKKNAVFSSENCTDDGRGMREEEEWQKLVQTQILQGVHGQENLSLNKVIAVLFFLPRDV